LFPTFEPLRTATVAVGAVAGGAPAQARLPDTISSFSFSVYVVDADSGTRFSVIAKAGTFSVLP
jgi:hypothetical protein